jgi:hypothetical protein
MTISSTKFQQNVGYYLKIAESGTIVNIVKSKPTQSQYQLKTIPKIQQNSSRNKLKIFLKKVATKRDLFDSYGNDSVKYVRGVRE